MSLGYRLSRGYTAAASSFSPRTIPSFISSNVRIIPSAVQLEFKYKPKKIVGKYAMGVNCKRSRFNGRAALEGEERMRGTLLHQRLPVVRLIENKFAEGFDLWQGHSLPSPPRAGTKKVRESTHTHLIVQTLFFSFFSFFSYLQKNGEEKCRRKFILLFIVLSSFLECDN